MNIATPASGAFHPLTWLIMAMGVLLLYVLSWPPVTLLFVTRAPTVPSYVPVITRSVSGHGATGTWTRSEIGYMPAWIARLYRPLHLWRVKEGEYNPLSHYWAWWVDRW